MLGFIVDLTLMVLIVIMMSVGITYYEATGTELYPRDAHYLFCFMFGYIVTSIVLDFKKAKDNCLYI